MSFTVESEASRIRKLINVKDELVLWRNDYNVSRKTVEEWVYEHATIFKEFTVSVDKLMKRISSFQAKKMLIEMRSKKLMTRHGYRHIV